MVGRQGRERSQRLGFTDGVEPVPHAVAAPPLPAQIGRALEVRLPRRLHANPAARPTPWRHVRWTGERYRLRHLDMRSRGAGVITPEGSGAAVTGRAVGGLASGSARQVIAAERRTLVADLVGKGLTTREIAAVVEVRTGRKVTPRTVQLDRKALGLEVPTGPASRGRPWEAVGMSRATWYRMRRNAKRTNG